MTDLEVEPLATTPPPATTNWVPMWNLGTPLPAAQPSSRLTRAAVFNVPSGAWTAIPFDAVRFDNGGQFAAGQPTRLTCQQGGTYVVSGTLEWGVAAGGVYRLAAVRLNGATMLAHNGMAGATIPNTATPRSNAATTMQLSVGDYIELMAFQDSGAPLNCASGYPTEPTEMAMALVGGMQGPPGGIPQPVTNGQWIKGVGGSAVWAPMTQADISGGIQTTPGPPPNHDLNQIVASGWYLDQNMANAPNPGWLWVQAYYVNANYASQTAWLMQDGNSPGRYMRQCNGGTWTAWRLLDDNAWTNLPYVGSWRSYGAGWWPASARRVGGIVMLRGLIARDGGAPAAGEAIASLPVGFRPVAGNAMMALCNCAGGGIRIDYDINGIRYGGETTGAAATPNAYTSLNGVIFFAEG